MTQYNDNVKKDHSKHKVILKMLPVLNGDCISINFQGNDNKRHNIIIDGGFQATYASTLKKEVEKIKNASEKIDLLVITHTDRDHIGGIIKLVDEYGDSGIIKKVWFNSSSGDINIEPSNLISIRDGISLRDKLINLGLLEDLPITNDHRKIDIKGALINIISPSQKELANVLKEFEETDQQDAMITTAENDYYFGIEELVKNKFSEGNQLYNATSIALLIEICGVNILLLSDSVPSVIIKWLKRKGYSEDNKLKVDYMSVPHHGSKKNLNDEMLSLIECENYLISANGMNRYNLPHKESLARIVTKSSAYAGFKLYFNYDNHILRSIFTNQEIEDYQISCFFGNQMENGLKLTYS